MIAFRHDGDDPLPHDHEPAAEPDEFEAGEASRGDPEEALAEGLDADPDGAPGDGLEGVLDPALAAELDEDFPLGDGTADTSATVECPYCTCAVEIALDPGSGSAQDYVEDCEVCCQPWHVAVRYGPEGEAEVWVEALEG